MEIHHKQASQSGFTLVEIIAILVLMSVLALSAKSVIFSNEADLVGDTDTLKSHLRFAQMKAMTTNSDWGINFNGSSYFLEENKSGTPSLTVFLPAANSATHTLSNGISANATTDPITFDEWGRPGNANITVTVSGGSSRNFVVTKNTGFIP